MPFTTQRHSGTPDIIVDVTIQKREQHRARSNTSSLRDDHENRLRLLPDQICISPRPPPPAPPPFWGTNRSVHRHILTLPLHMRCMHTPCARRIDIEPTLLMRTMIDPDSNPAAQMLVGDMLTRIDGYPSAAICERRQIIRQQPLFSRSRYSCWKDPSAVTCRVVINHMCMNIAKTSPALAAPVARAHQFLLREMNGKIHRRPMPVRQHLRKLPR